MKGRETPLPVVLVLLCPQTSSRHPELSRQPTFRYREPMMIFKKKLKKLVLCRETKVKVMKEAVFKHLQKELACKSTLEEATHEGSMKAHVNKTKSVYRNIMN